MPLNRLLRGQLAWNCSDHPPALALPLYKCGSWCPQMWTTDRHSHRYPRPIACRQSVHSLGPIFPPSPSRTSWTRWQSLDPAWNRIRRLSRSNSTPSSSIWWHPSSSTGYQSWCTPTRKLSQTGSKSRMTPSMSVQSLFSRPISKRTTRQTSQ